MIKNQIDNKQAFQVYVIANLIIALAIPLFVILSIFGAKTFSWNFSSQLVPLLGFIVLFSVWGLFETLVKPSYIEVIISEKEVVIKTFCPNIRNGLRFILMLGYRKHLKELRLSRQEYNDYKLQIDKLGLRKILVLQKIDLNGIYETSEININLLGPKKYTNLILSLDRLKGIINLN